MIRGAASQCHAVRNAVLNIDPTHLPGKGVDFWLLLYSVFLYQVSKNLPESLESRTLKPVLVVKCIKDED